MERLITDALALAIRMVLWMLTAPVSVARALSRWTFQLAGTYLLSTRDAMPCAGCGQLVSLVGRFECGRCHFVFDGYAFARCSVCGAVPQYLPCQRCAVGLKNPLLV